MKRLLPLALLSLLLVPARAAGDGCPPETCGVRSVAVTGSPVLALQPFGALEVYDLRTGARRFAAPYGVLSADGRAFWVSRNLRDRTDLRRRDARTGRLTRRYELRSHLGATAVSADGRFVALVDGRSARRRTGIAVLDARTGRSRELALAGSFWPEAVSRDGKRLFLIEYVRRGYRVRALDVDRGRLRPGELRAVNEDEPMRGSPAYAVAAPDGRWLLTLYVKPREREAFVHALDLRRGVAYCLDLPGHGGEVVLAKYALALAADGRTLVAANPVLGALAQIDLGTLELAPVLSFAGASDRSQNVNAAFSPRGDLVYFGGLQALWAYDLRARRVRGPYRVGPVGGFGFTQDGRRVLVVTPGGRPLWLHAATGKRAQA